MTPSGVRSVNNPLYSYKFHPLNSVDFPRDSGPLATKPQTIRASQMDIFLGSLGLKDNVVSYKSLNTLMVDLGSSADRPPSIYSSQKFTSTASLARSKARDLRWKRYMGACTWQSQGSAWISTWQTWRIRDLIRFCEETTPSFPEHHLTAPQLAPSYQCRPPRRHLASNVSQLLHPRRWHGRLLRYFQHQSSICRLCSHAPETFLANVVWYMLGFEFCTTHFSLRVHVSRAQRLEPQPRGAKIRCSHGRHSSLRPPFKHQAAGRQASSLQ